MIGLQKRKSAEKIKKNVPVRVSWHEGHAHSCQSTWRRSQWWGHGAPSKERASDWAAKEEVSKKERKRKYRSVLAEG